MPACIDYKAGDVKAGLKEHCPKGIDIYFDNVGGDILDAALTRINRKARIIICSAISQYTGSGSALAKNRALASEWTRIYTSANTHSRNRSSTALALPRRSLGRAFHWQPVRSRYTTASNTCRVLFAGNALTYRDERFDALPEIIGHHPRINSLACCHAFVRPPREIRLGTRECYLRISSKPLPESLRGDAFIDSFAVSPVPSFAAPNGLRGRRSAPLCRERLQALQTVWRRSASRPKCPRL